MPQKTEKSTLQQTTVNSYQSINTPITIASKSNHQDSSILPGRSFKVAMATGFILLLSAVAMLCYTEHLNKSDPAQAKYFGLTSFMLMSVGSTITVITKCILDSNEARSEAPTMRLV